MNPMQQLGNMMRGIKNPREFVMNYVKQNNNPVMNNLIQMAENGDTQGLENFARNMFKEQGQDFDQIKNSFR